MPEEKKLYETLPEIAWLACNSLKPYANNAKKHSKEQLAAIAESIKINGWVQPVVVDADGVIVIGHGRVEAAKLLGAERVPCIQASHLTPTQIKVLRLADNKLNESPWDMQLVTKELQEIKLEDPLQLSLTGFELEELPDDSKNEEVDVDKMEEELDTKCPKCGFQF